MEQNKKRKMKRAFEDLKRVALRMFPFIPGPELVDLVVNLQKSQSDLDEQVEDAIVSLKKSTELVNQLDEGVKQRALKLEELRSEYERYSKLADIESGKASALIQQLEQTVGSGRVRERWFSFLINIVAGILIFFAGVAFSQPVEKFFKEVQSKYLEGATKQEEVQE